MSKKIKTPVIDNIEPIKVDNSKERRLFKRFVKENILTVISIILTIITLSFTIFQGLKIREHNELSVTPLINLTYLNNYSDNSFHVEIKNKGTGPAIIDDMIFINNKKVYSTSKLQGGFWYNIFKNEKISDSFVYNNTETHTLPPGSAVSANEAIEILGFYSLKLKSEVYVSELTKLSNCKIKIKYHSIYNNTQYIDSIYFQEVKITEYIK